MSQIKLQDGNILKCPKCGYDCLHQALVEIYQRDGEDAPNGFAVSIDYSSMKLKTSQENNPSARRDGIRIYFICEECSAISEQNYKLMPLTIVQHKGNTFIEWEEG